MADTIDTITHISPIEESKSPPLKKVFTKQRLMLAALLLLSAFLEFFQLDGEGYANTYYAAGVKSMLTSWHNFFFVSFDAGGFVSLDKPPLGFWIQAASAKLFGFSGFSLLLPQALAGVLSVAVLYYLVTRAFGPYAGLAAGLVLALTPIVVVTDRNNTIDSLLILTLMLGAWAVSYATETGKLRWLLLCAVLVGLGFNIKMMQAYLVLPAFWFMYLLASPLRWRTRIWHLLLASVVVLAVSLSWAIIVDLTPASMRPFVSDSGVNSEISLIIGYNGLGRVTAAVISQVGALSFLSQSIDLSIAPGFAPSIGNPGVLRMFDQSISGQASWLLPLALLCLIIAATRIRRIERHFTLDRRGQAIVLWGAWLLTAVIYFSASRFFHLYYLVMFGPAIAALAGIAVVMAWEDYLRPGWRGWLLPSALLITAFVQVSMLSGYSQASWLTPLVIGICVSAMVLCVVARVRNLTMRGMLPAIVTVAFLALLLSPAVWDIISLQDNAGSAWLPQAGPSQGFSMGANRGGGGFTGGGAAPGGGSFTPGQAGTFPQGGQQPATGTTQGNAGGQGNRARNEGFGGGGGGGGGLLTASGPQWNTLDARLVSYLKAQQGKTTFLVATAMSSDASVFMLATNEPAMALGGYQGWDRIVTPTQLAQLVDKGVVRFFYLSSSSQSNTGGTQGAGVGGGTQGATSVATAALASTNDDLTKWVQTSCTAVSSSLWQTSATTGGKLLYDCANHK